MKASILMLAGLPLFAQNDVPIIPVRPDPPPSPVCAIPLFRVPADPRWSSKMPVAAPKSEQLDPIVKPPAIPSCEEPSAKPSTTDKEPRP